MATEDNIQDMERTWNEIIKGVNSTPTMVFSVIGDSESNVYRPWPTSVFKTALIDAAESGGETWILFLGTKKEVANVVKEAYKHFEDIRRFSNKKNEWKIKLISLNGKQDKKPDDEPKETYYTKADMTDATMVEFEKYISKQQVLFGMPVPIVILVCGGDIETIIHISKALKNKTPVIIMKGSGMAADLVADFIKKQDMSFEKARFLRDCGVDGEQHSSHEKLKKSLAGIHNNKNLVSVFDLEKDNPLRLSNIVGESVVNCWSLPNVNKSGDENLSETKANERSSKEITLHCKRLSSPIDKTLLKGYKYTEEEEKAIIEKFKKAFKDSYMPNVLNHEFLSLKSPPLYFYCGYHHLQELGFNNEIGQVLLREALKANRVDYVETLLDRGVFLKNAYLKDLYISSFQGVEGQKWILTQISKGLANVLLRKEEVSALSENDDSTEEMRTAMELCRKCIQYSEYTLCEGSQDENSSSILLWAILANRKEIAERCWLRGNELLLTGLVCSVLLKKLSEMAINLDDQVLKCALEKHSKSFEERCIHFMDGMYKENTNIATYLVKTKTGVWGIHCSPLDFAYENVMLDVVAHKCSQQSMTSQWYNNLSPDTLVFLKAVFTETQKFVSAPRTKYFVHYLLFLVMLVIHSVFVLTSVSTEYYNQNNAGVFECYVYFWVAGDVIEEVITCFGGLHEEHRSKKTLCTRLEMHLNNFWNLLDLFSYAIIILACFLRHFYVDTTFTVARRMFALSLFVMYLRFLEVFLIHKKLGPTLMMIKEMLKDLFSFLFIAVFVLFGVGIYYHANIWPDDQTILSGYPTEWKIWTILKYPYWQLFAELNLNYLEATEQPDCNKSFMSRCPQEDWTVPVVAAVYLLLSNLLLINLVIAKFSYTFQRVQNISEKLCWFEMYTAVIDYSWRIPSPINLLFLPYRFFSYMCPGSCNEAKDRDKNKEKYQRDFQRVIAVRIKNKV